MALIIGTAGWSIAASEAEHFARDGTALERYAGRFAGVEINSSFHRPHRTSTWERWAASVPQDFRFSVKLPKTITHQQRLIDCDDLLSAHLAETAPLGDRLAVHLVQLPPSLAFDAAAAEAFFGRLQDQSRVPVACEPRHPSWFEPQAEAMLDRARVARVAADPARVPAAAELGGWRGLSYFRLHGSPVPYRSSYDDARLDSYAARIRDAAGTGEIWCIFDNTASSAATRNALSLMGKMGCGARPSRAQAMPPSA